MTLLEKSFQDMPPEIVEGMRAWLAEKTPAVQQIVHQYPPRMKIFDKNGAPTWVIGYAETSDPTHVHLLVALCDPGESDENFDRASRENFPLCPNSISCIQNHEMN